MANVKIPKQVAGVKIPKKVRKKAKRAIKAVEGPMVRDFAAAAIGAVANARASRTGSRDVVRSASYRRTVGIDADRLAETIRNAALDGLRRFLEGFDEGMRDLSRPRDGEDAPRRGRKSGRD
jgi:hypothetical protein